MNLALSTVFGLLSMLAYGVDNAYSKVLAQRFGPAQSLFLRGVSASVILAVLAIPSFSHLRDVSAVLATLLLGAAGYLPVLAFMHGIKDGRLGIVAPVSGTTPLITVLLAFLFLAVPITTVQWAAIVLVVFANAFVLFDFADLRNSHVFRRSSGMFFALMAAVGWGLFYFLLVPSTHALGPWLSAFLVELGVTIAAAVDVRARSMPFAPHDLLRPIIVLNGALLCVGTLAYTIGVMYFNVGIVAALSNSTALISALMGALLFRERLHTREKVAVAAMVIGIAVVSSGI